MPEIPLYLQDLKIGLSTYHFTWDQGPLTPFNQQGKPWTASKNDGQALSPQTPYGLRLSSGEQAGTVVKVPIQPLPNGFCQGDQLSIIHAQNNRTGLKRPVMMVNHNRLTREIFTWSSDVLVPVPIKTWFILAAHFILLIIVTSAGSTFNLNLDSLALGVPLLLGAVLLLRRMIYRRRQRAFLDHVAAIQDVVIDRDLEKFLQIETATKSYQE